LEPNAFAGLIASLTEIASFLRELTASEIAERYRNRASNQGSPESKLGVDEARVEATAADVVTLVAKAPAFMEALNRGCFRPYREALEDFSISDAGLAEERERVRRCAVEALGALRDESGGAFSSPALQRLWDGLAGDLPA